jgi:hypothetical protein
MSDARQHAHELIDHISENQLQDAVGVLEKMLDPVSLALLNAPIDDEPLDEEDRLAMDESEEWFARNGGKGIPHDEAMRQLGLE